MIESLHWLFKGTVQTLLSKTDRWTYQDVYEAEPGAAPPLAFDRLWTPLEAVKTRNIPEGCRLFFHHFTADLSSSRRVDRYMHSHPWPMAVINLGPGSYTMRIQSKANGAVCSMVFSEGSSYALLSPDLQHDIVVTTETTTMMLAGPGWDTPSWTSLQKTFAVDSELAWERDERAWVRWQAKKIIEQKKAAQ